MRALALPGARRRVVAFFVVIWVGVWLAVGTITAVQVRRLTDVSDSLVQSGKALDVAGTALQDIGRLPVVGDRPRALGDEVRQTANDVHDAGDASRDTVRSVSVLLGLALVLIPVVPVVALYIPLRRAASRERRAVKRALSGSGTDPVLEEFLAHRAVHNLPYDSLTQVSADPWGDLGRGSFRRLANAELTRLGLAARSARGKSEAG